MKCPICKKEGAYRRLRTGEIVCGKGCGAITKDGKETKESTKTPKTT